MLKKIRKIPNFDNAGVLSLKDLKAIPGFPSETDFENDLVAVIECDEDIPCNPCEDVCPHSAIKVGLPITNLPHLDAKKCIGCLKCVAICPGLCIFVINKNFDDKNSLIFIPYEYSPLPNKGQLVRALNRKGEYVCKGIVYKVIKSSKKNSSSIVGIIVPKKFYNEVRHFNF